MRIIKKINTIICAFMFISLSFPVVAEKRGQVISQISFGGYQATDGQDTVGGSQLSIGMFGYFTDQWSFFFRL
ncbi:hypothetical protein KKA14_03590, partial [bacterium]|nr:hypothetical protein [bacterium]